MKTVDVVVSHHRDTKTSKWLKLSFSLLKFLPFIVKC